MTPHLHRWQPLIKDVTGYWSKGNEPAGGVYAFHDGILNACLCGTRAISFPGMPSLGIVEDEY